MGMSRAALAELLCSYYGQSYCVEVTVRVLRAMGRSTLAYALLHKLTYGASFVERYRKIVIQRASNVANVIMALLRERVLTSEQSDSIMSERTNQKRMQKLYELVPTWDVTNKYCLYKVLCTTNPILTLAYPAVQAQGSIISEDPWDDIFYLQGSLAKSDPVLQGGTWLQYKPSLGGNNLSTSEMTGYKTPNKLMAELRCSS
ncbi:uncharacterized protein LOC118159975 [Oxyura jamaicensis]|uniref:uncharacterized protein LOC118159975 n=1 Tax=Oxyura jamaicensis TaxID=8884 RepID=UPI0015A67951|nr:uncharacterized protein LOC118159975 [Oxyura jamaicensis]